MNKKINDLICPNDGSRLIKRSRKFYHFKDFKYPVISGIPCLYIDTNNNNKINLKKLNNVKKFYSKYPFPNYNDFDNIQRFVKKTKDNNFSKII